jgi:hypothetical protein
MIDLTWLNSSWTWQAPSSSNWAPRPPCLRLLPGPTRRESAATNPSRCLPSDTVRVTDRLTVPGTATGTGTASAVAAGGDHATMLSGTARTGIPRARAGQIRNPTRTPGGPRSCRLRGPGGWTRPSTPGPAWGTPCQSRCQANLARRGHAIARRGQPDSDDHDAERRLCRFRVPPVE